jgi:hypothetical protein
MSLKPSPQLATYINKIQTETGRTIVIERTAELGLGMLSALQDHPRYILVRIAVERQGRRITEQEIEYSIAHEITHGLLIYKEGYCQAVFQRPATNTERKTVSLLLTMVDDIVVNKIISDNGFRPFSPLYLSMVEKEIRAVQRGIDIYNRISNDPLIKGSYMVSRYITAWGFLEYFELERDERYILRTFLESFQELYPDQYEMAEHIKAIVMHHDIFTPSGHRKTIKQILSLWRLDDLVKLECIDH